MELTATPAAQSVIAGQTASYAVAINRTNFTGPVNLTVSGLPTRATASFNPTTVSGNRATLTVTIPSNTPTVTSVLTITGTASGVTIAPITVSLTVSPPVSSVSLSASPTAQSITAGGNVGYNIMLNRTNVTGAVALAVSGLPRGATAGFTLNPASSTNSVLIVSTLASTLPGTYSLTVSGTAFGVSITTTTVNLTVAAPKDKEKEKEFKEKDRKEFKEKDRKEKDIDGKDFTEFPFPSSEVVSTTARLAHPEGAVGQLTHFIPQDLRPGLEASALKGEPDLGYADPAVWSRQLQKQASDAQQAKNLKDMEKVREVSA